MRLPPIVLAALVAGACGRVRFDRPAPFVFKQTAADQINNRATLAATLLFAAIMFAGGGGTAGSGFTLRSPFGGDVTEDRRSGPPARTPPPRRWMG